MNDELAAGTRLHASAEACEMISITKQLQKYNKAVRSFGTQELVENIYFIYSYDREF